METKHQELSVKKVGSGINLDLNVNNSVLLEQVDFILETLIYIFLYILP